MLNDKKDKMNHFLSANKISFNACYLSERIIHKTFRQKRDKNLRIIFAWGDFRVL